MTYTRVEQSPTVLIASFLEAEYVERIRRNSPGDVLYAPELLPQPRYRNDHTGTVPALSAPQRAAWLDLVSQAEVAFDFDWMAPGDLPNNAPKLRWVQATSAGIGGFVERNGLDATSLTITTAAGIHARPLAEFAAAAILHFVRDIPRLQRDQRNHHWERYESGQLAGRTVTIVGLGSVGKRLASLCQALNADVVGIVRTGSEHRHEPGITIRTTEDLDGVLSATDILILCCPLTEHTRNLIDADRLALLSSTAIVVNLARGLVIDEDALIARLADRRIGAAALDVFSHEPLAPESPLWDMPNVLISPHSASTVAGENELLTDLFVDNLARYLTDEPMRNLYQRELGY
ncbi:MAG: D-2-hydroxyacid dehydrogenase [Nocardioidaceae bacterium]